MSESIESFAHKPPSLSPVTPLFKLLGWLMAERPDLIGYEGSDNWIVKAGSQRHPLHTYNLEPIESYRILHRTTQAALAKEGIEWTLSNLSGKYSVFLQSKRGVTSQHFAYDPVSALIGAYLQLIWAIRDRSEVQ